MKSIYNKLETQSLVKKPLTEQECKFKVRINEDGYINFRLGQTMNAVGLLAGGLIEYVSYTTSFHNVELLSETIEAFSPQAFVFGSLVAFLCLTMLSVAGHNMMVKNRTQKIDYLEAKKEIDKIDNTCVEKLCQNIKFVNKKELKLYSKNLKEKQL